MKLRFTPYQIPFSKPFRTAAGEFSFRYGIILQLHGDGNMPCYRSEAAPLPGFSSDSYEQVLDRLFRDQESLTSFFSKLHGLKVEDVRTFLRAYSDVPSLEFALGSLVLQINGLPWVDVGAEGLADESAGEANVVGEARDETRNDAHYDDAHNDVAAHDARDETQNDTHYDVAAHDPYRHDTTTYSQATNAVTLNAVAGIMDSESLLDHLEKKYHAGFRTFKCKVDNKPGILADTLKQFYETRSDVTFRLDANRSWPIDQLHFLSAYFRDLPVEYIEEPTAVENAAQLRKVLDCCELPLALDESIQTPASLQLLASCDCAEDVAAWIIKPTLFGDLFGLMALIHRFKLRDRLVITSSFETPAGRSVLGWLALQTGSRHYAHGLDTGDLLAGDLLTEDRDVRGGGLPVSGWSAGESVGGGGAGSRTADSEAFAEAETHPEKAYLLEWQTISDQIKCRRPALSDAQFPSPKDLFLVSNTGVYTFGDLTVFLRKFTLNMLNNATTSVSDEAIGDVSIAEFPVMLRASTRAIKPLLISCENSDELVFVMATCFLSGIPVLMIPPETPTAQVLDRLDTLPDLLRPELYFTNQPAMNDVLSQKLRAATIPDLSDLSGTIFTGNATADRRVSEARVEGDRSTDQRAMFLADSSDRKLNPELHPLESGSDQINQPFSWRQLIFSMRGDVEVVSADIPSGPGYPDADSIACIMYTSGSSGSPKAVPVRTSQIIAAADAAATFMKPAPGTYSHLMLPMSHIGGASVLYRSILYGTPVLLQLPQSVPIQPPTSVSNPAEPQDRKNPFLNESRRLLHQNPLIHCTSMVPTQLSRLVERGDFKVHSAMKTMLIGGGHVHPELVKRVRDQDLPVRFSYGMTETAAMVMSVAVNSKDTVVNSKDTVVNSKDIVVNSKDTVVNSKDTVVNSKGIVDVISAEEASHVRQESNGSPWMTLHAGVQAHLEEIYEEDRPVAKGERTDDVRAEVQGGLWVKGPQVFSGYADQNPAIKSSMGSETYHGRPKAKVPNDEGWFCTGDIVSRRCAWPAERSVLDGNGDVVGDVDGRGQDVVGDVDVDGRGQDVEGRGQDGDGDVDGRGQDVVSHLQQNAGRDAIEGSQIEKERVYQYRIEMKREDRIVTGGKNVDPREVENCFRQLDIVADAAVVGVPDPEWGQLVVAFVVLKRVDEGDAGCISSDSLTDAAGVPKRFLKDLLAEHLERYKIPKRVWILEKIPATSLLKVKRGELMKMAIAHLQGWK